MASFPLAMDGSQDNAFIERYVWVVFYYSTGGDTTWREQCNFLNSFTSHCNWRCPIPSQTQQQVLDAMDGFSDGMMGLHCMPLENKTAALTHFEFCKYTFCEGTKSGSWQ